MHVITLQILEDGRQAHICSRTEKQQPHPSIIDWLTYQINKPHGKNIAMFAMCMRQAVVSELRKKDISCAGYNVSVWLQLYVGRRRSLMFLECFDAQGDFFLFFFFYSSPYRVPLWSRHKVGNWENESGMGGGMGCTMRGCNSKFTLVKKRSFDTVANINVLILLFMVQTCSFICLTNNHIYCDQ